jgi:hypothetical protein
MMTINNKNGYLYIRINELYQKYNSCKFGITECIINRDGVYTTGEIKRGYFELVVQIPHDKMKILEKLLQNYFKSLDLHIIYDGGTEFFKNDIIKLVIPFLQKINIKFKVLSRNEINNLIRKSYYQFKKINIKNLLNVLKNYVSTLNCSNLKTNRPYQSTIINYSTIKLKEEHRIYIELATGGGKSVISYNLFSNIDADTILIFSPRKIINVQNIKSQYLDLLNYKYDVYNFSNNTISFNDFIKLPNKKLIIACTQSSDKVYEYIIRYNIKNITIWFDEAHWAVEEWINNENKLFWLIDNDFIKDRIFTSASPNKELCLNNIKYFGELYSPIKVNELIKLKWLCSIQPHVFSINKDNNDLLYFNLEGFTRLKRKFGFCFHNKQINAFNLFYKHYIKYKANEITIKPFLLVGEDFNEPEIIKLNYDYKNIDIYQNNNESIGYVVAKYSMGYDFNKMDFMSICDPKLSIKDIIQCIGRGLRPDELGINKTNLDKFLVVFIPIFINFETENKFEKVIQVLHYLIIDIGLTFDKIIFNDINKKLSIIKIDGNEYDGIEEIKSMILDLLSYNIQKDISYEKTKKIISNYNFLSPEEYLLWCDKDLRLPKDPKLKFNEQFINWMDYLSIKNIYYNFETCIKKVNEYLLCNKINDIELNNIAKKLKELDNNFPPYDLWKDYYNINDLSDIIKYNNIEELAFF